MQKIYHEKEYVFFYCCYNYGNIRYGTWTDLIADDYAKSKFIWQRSKGIFQSIFKYQISDDFFTDKSKV